MSGNGEFSIKQYVKKCVLKKYKGPGGDVVIPEEVTDIGSWAFQRCAGLTGVTIPERVTTIGSFSFSGCIGLSHVTFPQHMSRIGEHAFYNCASLTNVTIPEHVTQIGEYAFFGCTELSDVTILGKPEMGKESFPASVAVIVAEQLRMEDYSLPAHKQAAARGFARRYTSGAELPEDYRADCLKYIKSRKKRLYPVALQDSALLRVMLGEKMVPKGDLPDLIDQAAAMNQPEVTAMLLAYQEQHLKPGEREKREEKKMQREMDFLLTGTLTAAEAKKSWRYEKDKKGHLCILGYKGKETDLVVPDRIGKDKVTAIGAYAFSPDGKSITEEQRQVRRQIRSILLPEGMKEIGGSAFVNCASLERLHIPSTVKRISTGRVRVKNAFASYEFETNAFWGCRSLTELTVDEKNTAYRMQDGLLVTRQEAEYGLVGRLPDLAGVCVIPEVVRMIPDAFFENCTGLTKVVLPNTLQRIYSDAFAYCTNLAEINIPDGVVFLDDHAFRDCAHLKEIILPASVRTVGLAAFSSCTELKSVLFSEGITTLGNYIFRNCANLQTVALPASVSSMGIGVFSGCSNLAIHAPAGSYAEAYAKKHDIPYQKQEVLP